MSVANVPGNWFRRHRGQAFDLGLLVAVVETAGILAWPALLAWKTQAVIFVIAVLLPSRRPPPELTPWRVWLVRLPWQLAVGAAAALVLTLALDAPPRVLLVFPLWIAASLTAALLRPFRFVVFRPVLDRCRRSLEERRGDLLAAETAIVGCFAYGADHFWPQFWPGAWAAVATATAWPAGRLLAGGSRPRTALLPDFWRLSVAGVATLLVGGVLLIRSGTPALDAPHLTLAAWGAVALLAHRLWIRRLPSDGGRAAAENVRVLTLVVAGLWLMRGFARPTLHGTGDAQWYGTMLADMVAQTRSGVFPVWLGQSIDQFNGAIYPLRVAPAFHYLGALLDTLTLHTLGVFALQNLLLTLIGTGTLLVAHFCLGALLPARRWSAAGMALLFVACPGVLGIAYNTDLYMSWTTLPWVTLAGFASVRSFRDRGAPASLVLLAGSLGLCWWGHSPIALWTTLVAATVQTVRLARQRPHGRDWRRLTVAGAVFAATAAYPLGSVLLFPPEHGMNATGFQSASAGTVLYFLRQACPAIFLPLSQFGRSLGDFQLGYALWAALIYGLWSSRRTGAVEARCLLGFALLFAVLLIPVPVVTPWLWRAVPALVRNVTGNWPMNRLYLLLAVSVVFGTAAAVAAAPPKKPVGRWWAAVLALACAWSAIEASHYAAGSRQQLLQASGAVDRLRPENVLLTSYAYLIFPRPPPDFSHGVVDPALHERLLQRGTLVPLDSNWAVALDHGREVARERFAVRTAGPTSWLELPAPLILEPGRRYLLDWQFLDSATDGVVELSGSDFFREYALPEYGGPESFGIGGHHAHWIPLWTTTAGPEPIRVQFFPTPGKADAKTLAPFADVRLIEYDPTSLPVQVDGWIPYRAVVQSPAAAWLETPRMYQDRYVARVDGQPAPVMKSPRGLVCVAVPAGASRVLLAYVPAPGLVALFWVSLLSIAALACGAARLTWFHRQPAGP